jgi:hypothetical protein
MSRLEYYARPLVAFDVTNKEHRRHYYNFVKTRGWGSCPVRFICPDTTGHDLVGIIQRQLVEYYVNKEFNKE